MIDFPVWDWAWCMWESHAVEPKVYVLFREGELTINHNRDEAREGVRR